MLNKNFIRVPLRIFSLFSALTTAGIVDLRAEEIYYHSNTYNASVTSFPGMSFPVAVEFDLPVPSQTYEIESLGVLSAGDENPFPTNTEIAIRVWDSSGVPIFTSSTFDLSGQDGSLSMRWFDISDNHIQVSNSFYMGYQDLTGSMHFGYKVDVPSGNNYGRSYRYSVSNGTWTPLSEDLWFNATVSAVITDATWTGVSSSEWSDPNNWNPIGGGPQAIFDDSAAGTTSVSITPADVSPTSVTFNNDTKPYTVSGPHGIVGAATLLKQGEAKVTISTPNSYTGRTTQEGGVLQLNGSGAWNPVFNLGGADIKSGRMVFDYNGGTTPAATILALLTVSYHHYDVSILIFPPDSGTHFDIGQFQSSTADDDCGLGWRDDTMAKKVTVAYTLYGDATLNGSVDISDLSVLGQHWNKTTGAVWAEGDFNYDGRVDISDLSYLGQHWNQNMSGSSGGEAGAARIPEPGTLAMLVAGLLGLAAYAWRRQR